MKAKRSIALLLLSLAITSLAGCQSGPAAPTPTTVPSPVSTACVDFEPPLTLGTKYGQSSGNNPGDIIFTSSGVPVSVREFGNSINPTSFNEAFIDTAPVAFGASQSIRTNNINLEFDFSSIGFTPSLVELDFLDKGGYENLSVNGGQLYFGELSQAPSSLGPITFGVSTTPVSGGTVGKATFKGAVQTLRIGGQEFWIDNVCAK